MRWLRVEGRSMWPTLRPGDEAALSEPSPTLGPGDVVVARHPSGEGLVIHRVRRVDPDGRWILRGDGCARDDAPVTREHLVAQVRRVRRGGQVLLAHEWDRSWLLPLGAVARLVQRGVSWRRGA